MDATAMVEPLHYTGCGLPNIWLRNGFVVEETSYGEAVSIDNLDGLHCAIGLDLANNKPNLTSNEVRFLRKEMDLPQVQLAQLLGVVEATVRNWENGRAEIPGPADRILRTLYLEFAEEESLVREKLERISQLNREEHERQITFAESDGTWRTAA